MNKLQLLINANPAISVFCTIACLLLIVCIYQMWKGTAYSYDIKDELRTPHDIEKSMDTIESLTIKMYAGCLGTCNIIYQYSAGVPTMEANHVYADVVLLSVRLVNGLTLSGNVLPMLTDKQTRLLETAVYREHEKREINSIN